MNKRNGLISLMKFIFSIVIMLFHSNSISGKDKFLIAYNGYICVEFFFIVSGYYFARRVEKDFNKRTNIYKDNIRMIIDKFKKFLPYTIIASIFILIVMLLLNKISVGNILLSVFNTFLIDMCGIKTYHLNTPIWYLSSLLISMFILYPIIRKNKDKYIYYFAPLLVLLCAGYINNNYTSLDVWDNKWNLFINVGLVRAIMDINIGIIIYFFLKNIEGKINKITLKTKIIMHMLTFLLYSFFFCFIFLYERTGQLDFFALLIISLALLLSFSGVLYDKIFKNKFVYYLEKLSLPMYINHWLFRFIFVEVSKHDNYKFIFVLIIYILCSIIFSVIELKFIDLINKRKEKKYVE